MGRWALRGKGNGGRGHSQSVLGSSSDFLLFSRGGVHTPASSSSFHRLLMYVHTYLFICVCIYIYAYAQVAEQELCQGQLAPGQTLDLGEIAFPRLTVCKVSTCLPACAREYRWCCAFLVVEEGRAGG
jgi:hypothetical protein